MADIVAAIIVFVGGMVVGGALVARQFAIWLRDKPEKIREYLRRAQAKRGL